MKKILFSLCLLLALTGSSNSAYAFAGGSGTPADPWQISTVEQLQDIDSNSTTLAGHYIQINDIDAIETNGWNGGNGFDPIGYIDYANGMSNIEFSGRYNGQGYSISNLYIYGDTSGSYTGFIPPWKYKGLFAKARNAQITNVSLINITVDADFCGGLVADAISSDIEYVSVTGNVTGDTYIGGIAGRLVGSDIENSYSMANVSGSNGVGGIAGYAASSSAIRFSYAAGPVSGSTDTGGIVGGISSFISESIYYDINTTGQTSGFGTEATTSEMQTQSTFVNWDFNNIWFMDGYPALYYERSDDFYLYPGNQTIDFDAPPLIHEITLDMYKYGADEYDITVATDSLYSNVVYSSNPTAPALLVNKTVDISLYTGQYYMIANATDSSGNVIDTATSIFEITHTFNLGSTAVAGTVYEVVNGINTPVRAAIVTVYNDTFSDDYITGSNGYYQFTELAANETYFLVAKKDGYEDSSINIFSTEYGQTAYKNIIMQKESSPNYITPHYVRFIVTDCNYARYSDATVTIYEGDSATALYTLTSGADGACGAELSETVEYRIVCEYEDQTVTFNIYPTDDVYRIYLDTSLLPDRDRLAIEEVQITVIPSEINSTHANVYVNYVDNMSETTSLYLYVNNSDGGVLASGDIYPATSYNFTIQDYQGNDYNIIVKAEHGTFGSIVRQYSIHFNNTSLDIGIWGTWIAVACILMVAMGSGKADADKAAGGILVLVFIFMAIGWLPHTLEFTTSYAVAFVVVVAWHMKNRDRSVAE